MLEKEICVEYFFDSKKYNKEQIIEKMKKEEKVFEKSNSRINIDLNKYGIYEVKLKFIKKKILLRKHLKKR